MIASRSAGPSFAAQPPDRENCVSRIFSVCDTEPPHARAVIVAAVFPERQSSREGGGCAVIATVMHPDRAGIEAAILEAARGGADAAEVRFDAAPGVDPASIGRPDGFPLIGSCRSRADGGLFAGSDEERIGVLDRAAEGGFALDVEEGSPAERWAAEKGARRGPDD